MLERGDSDGTKTEMALMHVANAGFVGMRLSCPNPSSGPSRSSSDEHCNSQAVLVRERLLSGQRVFRQWTRYVKGALAGIMN
jgi:hypothetical protein